MAHDKLRHIRFLKNGKFKVNIQRGICPTTLEWHYMIYT